MNKITFEKLNDGTCVITVLGMNDQERELTDEEKEKYGIWYWKLHSQIGM